MDMNNNRRYLFTPDGIKRLRQRIARARAAYKEICDSNEDAAGSGDSSVWHDNFAYEENQRQMHQQAKRVRDLEGVLAAAEVVPPHELRLDRVTVGTWVSCQKDRDSKPRRFYIAGYDDGEPSLGRISYNSPMGRHLMGAEEGDVLEIFFAGRHTELEILEVSTGPEPEEVQ